MPSAQLILFSKNWIISFVLVWGLKLSCSGCKWCWCYQPTQPAYNRWSPQTICWCVSGRITELGLSIFKVMGSVVMKSGFYRKLWFCMVVSLFQETSYQVRLIIKGGSSVRTEKLSSGFTLISREKKDGHCRAVWCSKWEQLFPLLTMRRSLLIGSLLALYMVTLTCQIINVLYIFSNITNSYNYNRSNIAPCFSIIQMRYNSISNQNEALQWQW